MRYSSLKSGATSLCKFMENLSVPQLLLLLQAIFDAYRGARHHPNRVANFSERMDE
jgi:hypothetical protein